MAILALGSAKNELGVVGAFSSNAVHQEVSASAQHWCRGPPISTLTVLQKFQAMEYSRSSKRALHLSLSTNRNNSNDDDNRDSYSEGEALAHELYEHVRVMEMRAKLIEQEKLEVKYRSKNPNPVTNDNLMRANNKSSNSAGLFSSDGSKSFVLYSYPEEQKIASLAAIDNSNHNNDQSFRFFDASITEQIFLIQTALAALVLTWFLAIGLTGGSQTFEMAALTESMGDILDLSTIPVHPESHDVLASLI